MAFSETAIQSLQKTLELLKTEQEEDRNQYKEKILKSPLNERKKLGITWYPIVIKDHYYGVGERLILEVERPGNHALENNFQFGSIASLFSNFHNEGIENPSIAGVVSSVRQNLLKITFFVDELPEWTSNGKLGLDLLFDETSYKEMDIALNKTIKARNNRLSHLRDVMLGEKEPDFRKINPVLNPSLNASQNRALNLVSSCQDLAIIHGPPGTGKTTTMIACIMETLLNEDQVLVCAPSNAAVDLVTESLAKKGIEVIRIGNPAKVSESLLQHTLDSKITNHPQFKQIKEFRKRAAEFRTMGSKYKRSFGKEERDQRRMIFDESRKLQIEAERIENFIIEDSITKARVITATLVGCANYVIRDRVFSTVFIDEAGQALEPANWIPITKAERVIMAGDHLQLPPTIKSNEAARMGLNITLMEKCMVLMGVSEMLKVQYRMNELIMNFPSKHFYEGCLEAHESVKNSTFSGQDGSPLPVVEFIDTAGCSFIEESDKDSQSLYNKEEANLLIKRLELFCEDVGDLNFTAGIITPYKAQINYLRELVGESEIIKSMSLSTNTVDGFQGQERDLICISLVRSNDLGEIGFLADTRRMNVAMTRAKKKLIVIGDSGTLARHWFYKSFLEYIDEIDAYKSAWEFMY